jgi:hypothetical protein
MKKISLVLFLAIITTFSYAQDIDTFGKRDTSKAFIMGGYGEPFAGATQINNDWGIMFGVKGGVSFNRKFSFGPIAKVNIGLWEFQGNNLAGSDSAYLELYMGSVGLFLEYTFKMEKKIHFSIPVNIMVGGTTINNATDFKNNDKKGNDNSVESTGLFIVEPELNIEFNVAKFFIPNLQVGYRAVFGSELVNASSQELSGVYFGIGLKFGKF